MQGDLMNAFIPVALLINLTGIGSGRLLPTIAAVLALIGVVVGSLALLRSPRGGNGRSGAIVSLFLAAIGLAIGGLHASNSAGGFGTGNGLAGAIVAMVLGLVGVVFSGLALARVPRLERDSNPES